MGLDLRWVGDDERDRVAETRMLCYASGRSELGRYIDRIRGDIHIKGGDFLLAERDGEPVGTATGIPMTMWVRGGPVPCQGVGFVGTIKTQRRKRIDGRGIATALMQETLRSARERGYVVSALMPFRGSFYEHVGYGFVERRRDWTLPMSILPRGDFDDFRFFKPDDLDELIRFKQRLTERTHGDIERHRVVWERFIRQADNEYQVVDRATGGPIRAYLAFGHVHNSGPDTLRVSEAMYEDIDGLKRILHFLESLRDQYTNATLILPADLRLNWLLRETQMTHRANRNHATAEARPFNRMQVRVLDHGRLLSAMRSLPAEASGKTVVAVHEPEGETLTLAIELAGGRASAVKSSAAAAIELDARTWAAVVFGDLPASEAARLGLLKVHDHKALPVLDLFASGPAPWCHEYF
jgi:predicted acetyltransferase